MIFVQVCWIRFEHLKTVRGKASWGSWGQHHQGFVAQLRHLEIPNRCFCVCAKTQRIWPIHKSIRKIIPILVAVLKPCKTFRNALPDQKFRILQAPTCLHNQNYASPQPEVSIWCYGAPMCERPKQTNWRNIALLSIVSQFDHGGMGPLFSARICRY